jgi:hypothetical protein
VSKEPGPLHIETFERGCTPRHHPTAPTRIDSSRLPAAAHHGMPTAADRHRAVKSGRAQWPDRRVRSPTAPSPSTATMVQPHSAAAISRPAPRPTSVPPSRHPVRPRSQIPIDRSRPRHRCATPARGFLPRGFSDACRPEHTASFFSGRHPRSFNVCGQPPQQRRILFLTLLTRSSTGHMAAVTPTSIRL